MFTEEVHFGCPAAPHWRMLSFHALLSPASYAASPIIGLLRSL